MCGQNVMRVYSGRATLSLILSQVGLLMSHAYTSAFIPLLWPILFPAPVVSFSNPKTFLAIPAQKDLSCLEKPVEPIVCLPTDGVRAQD